MFVESSVSNDFSKGIENVQYLDTTAGRLEHYRLVQFEGENYKFRKSMNDAWMMFEWCLNDAWIILELEQCLNKAWIMLE